MLKIYGVFWKFELRIDSRFRFEIPKVIMFLKYLVNLLQMIDF